eukprot:Gb_25317 [translate_table: standard]
MGEMKVCPEDLRFTVDSIKSTFRPPHHTLRIQDAVERIQKKLLSPNDFTPMNVVQLDGISWCLDNRRLWVFRKSRVSVVTVNLVSPDYSPKSVKFFTNLEPRVEWDYSRPSYYPRVRVYVKLPAAIVHPGNTPAKDERSHRTQTNNEAPIRPFPEKFSDSETKKLAERSMTPVRQHNLPAQLQNPEKFRESETRAFAERSLNPVHQHNLPAQLQKPEKFRESETRALTERSMTPVHQHNLPAQLQKPEKFRESETRALTESSMTPVHQHNLPAQLQKPEKFRDSGTRAFSESSMTPVHQHNLPAQLQKPEKFRESETRALTESSMTPVHQHNLPAQLQKPEKFRDSGTRAFSESSVTPVHQHNLPAQLQKPEKFRESETRALTERSMTPVHQHNLPAQLQKPEKFRESETRALTESSMTPVHQHNLPAQLQKPEKFRESETRALKERSMTPVNQRNLPAQLQEDHITPPARPLAEQSRNTEKMAYPVRPTSIIHPDNAFTAKLQRDHHDRQIGLNERPSLPRPLSEECRSTQERAVAESSITSVPPNNVTGKLQGNHAHTHISTERSGRPLGCSVAQKKAVTEKPKTVLHLESIIAEVFSRDPPVAKINTGQPTLFQPLPQDPRDTHKKSVAEGSMTSVHTENAAAKVQRDGITGINRERTILPKPLPERGTVITPQSKTSNPTDDVRKASNLPRAAQPNTDNAAAHVPPKNVPVKTEQPTGSCRIQ